MSWRKRRSRGLLLAAAVLLIVLGAVRSLSWAGISVIVDPQLAADGALVVGQHKASPGEGEWVLVSAMYTPQNVVYASLLRFKPPFFHRNEVWLAPSEDGGYSVQAKMRTFEETDPGGGWRARNLRGTVWIDHPIGNSSEDLVLKYRITGDQSGSPVDYEGKVVVPAR